MIIYICNVIGYFTQWCVKVEFVTAEFYVETGSNKTDLIRTELFLLLKLVIKMIHH